jgi:hypothetical protein
MKNLRIIQTSNSDNEVEVNFTEEMGAPAKDYCRPGWKVDLDVVVEVERENAGHADYLLTETTFRAE